MSDLTRILNSVEAGDPKAAEELLPQLDDLLMNRLGQLGLAGRLPGRLQPSFTELLVKFDPVVEAALRHAYLGADILGTESFLQPQPDGLELVGRGIACA